MQFCNPFHWSRFESRQEKSENLFGICRRSSGPFFYQRNMTFVTKYEICYGNRTSVRMEKHELADTLHLDYKTVSTMYQPCIMHINAVSSAYQPSITSVSTPYRPYQHRIDNVTLLYQQCINTASTVYR